MTIALFKSCQIKGCYSKINAKGVCDKHYYLFYGKLKPRPKKPKKEIIVDFDFEKFKREVKPFDVDPGEIIKF